MTITLPWDRIAGDREGLNTLRDGRQTRPNSAGTGATIG